MNLLDRTTRLLSAQRSPFAVIGAAALAIHGVARSTQDIDLLVTDRRCLDVAYWRVLAQAGIAIAVHEGDSDDPLAGVARLRVENNPPLDVVVGKARWQAAAIDRAVLARIAGVEVPAVTAADLVLMKLYAGGPQDAWDIVQLLGAAGPALAEDVQARLGGLPDDARRLWIRLTTDHA